MLLGAIGMGVIQGLTEFLPVSSSGHLVVGSHVFHLAEPSLLFNVILHVGTLVPVLWLYRRDVVEMVEAIPRAHSLRDRFKNDQPLRTMVLVLLGSIPTGLIGVLLKDHFERLFSNLPAVATAFCVTGLVLLATRLPMARKRKTSGPAHLSLTPIKALVIGIVQGLAITPGISRSGSTIGVGLLMGVERELAARFSFLLSIPAILGATVLQMKDATLSDSALASYLVGAIAASISGYLALRFVVHLVKRGGVHWFVLYLWPLAVFVYSVSP